MTPNPQKEYIITEYQIRKLCDLTGDIITSDDELLWRSLCFEKEELLKLVYSRSYSSATISRRKTDDGNP